MTKLIKEKGPKVIENVPCEIVQTNMHHSNRIFLLFYIVINTIYDVVITIYCIEVIVFSKLTQLTI